MRPKPNVMYGLTHAESGDPIVRVPRTVKVGIGRPAGPDIHVWIDASGKWAVAIGGKGEGGKRIERIHRFESREQAQKFYREQRQHAPALPYPMKLQYFTFSRPGGEGVLEPEWDSIEKHGPLPTEIDVVFTDDQPLHAAYEMWSATGLQCRGDGINAERVLDLASTPAEKELAKQAKDNGEKVFPIVDGCRERGCTYAQEKEYRGKPVAPLCKPHGRLAFQLISDIRLCAQAQFDTTSFRSVSQLHSSLHELRKFTGGGDPGMGFVVGIPLRLVVRPWKANFRGQAVKAYAVSLELRTEAIAGLRKRLLEYGSEFKAGQIEAPRKQIAEPVDTPEYSESDAAAITSEFYVDPESVQGPDDESDRSAYEEAEPEPEPPADESAQVAAKTQAATEELRGRLKRAKRDKPEPAPETAEEAEPEPGAEFRPPAEELF